MHTPDRCIPERKLDTSELARPVQGEPMGIRVEECLEGGFEARFRLALSGLAHTQEDPGCEQRDAWAVNVLHGLFRGLADDETIEFNYAWRRGNAATRRFSWQVGGTTKAESREAALCGAQDLSQGLEMALGNSAGGLEFSPQTGSWARPGQLLRWRYVMQPLGLVVPADRANTMGYTAVRAGRQRVVLGFPAGGERGQFDSILRAGSVNDATLGLTVQIEPMRLPAQSLEILRVALNNLWATGAGQLRLETTGARYTSNDAVIAHTFRQLQHWINDPRGYRVRCVLHAEQALPPVLVEAIGRELFHGMPVTLTSTSDGNTAAVESERDLDTVRLNQCFARECGDPPSLLPSTRALEEIGTRRIYSAVPENLPEAGVMLGYCGSSRRRSTVRLPDTVRDRHCYIMGATGTGKSTLMLHMMAEDMQQGKGVCLIDPHGDLFEQTFSAVPTWRADDVVLLDLADSQWPVGLNFLECDGENRPVQEGFVVNEMMTIFRRLYGDVPESLGPVFETYMRNAMLLVMGNQHQPASLLDVVRIFEDKSFRAQAKKSCRNPMVVSFWSEQAEKAGGEMSLENVAPYITSKLNQFTHNALLRPIIGQRKSTINLRKCMDDGRIVLVNLAKGHLGELDMRLLGMLLVGKLFSAALGRVSMPASQRRPFHVYVDEFQNIMTPTIVGLLSEARKFGLSITMANQHFAQLSGKHGDGVADAVLGNVATMLLFRMGPKDAERMETYTRPLLNAHDLQSLPDHHVACRMVNGNELVRPFVFSTTPPSPLTVEANVQWEMVERIRCRSRRQYAQRRECIEEQIMRGWAGAS